MMETIYSYSSVPENLRGGVIAIGNYDGVHRGHQIIIDRVKLIAREKGCIAGIMCFNPHPREFFLPDQPHFYLSSQDRKLRLLEKFGIELAVILPFNSELANLSAERFETEVLRDGLSVSHVVVGYNFLYGKGRQGTPDTLMNAGLKLGFDVTVISEQNDGDSAYSSTRIRDLLRNGKVRQAADLLGYWWRVSGTVMAGAQKGAGLGFPTANIHLLPGQDMGHGIYAVYAYVDGVRFSGAAYMGGRPTFDNGSPVLEVFLFDFEGNLYGRKLEVEFIGFIRGDRKFDTIDDLVVQMNDDCDRAKEILMSDAIKSDRILSV